MKLASGTLIVRPTSAKLTYDTEFFGSMDPFANITIGSSTQKTRTANDMGKNPVWSDTLTFNIRGDQQMHVSLFDKDVGSKDDYIAETSIPLLDIFSKKTHSEW